MQAKIACIKLLNCRRAAPRPCRAARFFGVACLFSCLGVDVNFWALVMRVLIASYSPKCAENNRFSGEFAPPRYCFCYSRKDANSGGGACRLIRAN
ncbi:hypothetical protein CSC3H3_23760 (plasmid) [Thalassospira marina]|uniref:Secreted protein n=1 Tax=Thalassospira marina TaxID=2048283 RepID=A0ABN5FTQ8_9PROT|nr:hypothetical protein CSC3H3_23760 [Thalassospira marina]